MKKSPLFALKNSNAASQSVPNKKPPSTSTLNYLQILKQYNSCNKLVKNEASSLQPAARTKTSKDATTVNLILQQNLKPRINNINTSSAKNLGKPNINNHFEEKMGIPSPTTTTYSSKLLNKYMVKVPFDSYLRSSKNKENYESKPTHPPIIVDKSEKENIYFIGDKNLNKRSCKIPSNGSERNSLHKEKMQSSPRERLYEHEKNEGDQNHGLNTCFFHPDKKAKYMKTKDENCENSAEVNYYCSKCAIDLAVKGIRVYDIEENKTFIESSPPIILNKKESLHSFVASPGNNSPKIEEKSDFERIYKTPTRRDEIDEFLTKLEGAKKNGNSSCALLEKRKEDIANFYIQQITKTDEFFKRMEIVLQTNKRILIDKLHKFKEEAESAFKNLIKQSECNLTEIQKIEFDIRENVENILKNMEELPFKTIITKYDSKITLYQKSFFELCKEPLILNKILISFKNYKEQENNYSKFNEEVWNLVRPYFSFNRIPVTFLEEDNDLELMISPRNDFKKDIFVSFENKELFEENQKSIHGEDEKKELYGLNEKNNSRNDNAHSTIAESLSSPTSKKYLELLNKINNNQENNNIFFSNLMIKNESGPPLANEPKNNENSCQEFIKFKKKQENIQANNVKKNLFFSPNFRENLEI